MHFEYPHRRGISSIGRSVLSTLTQLISNGMPPLTCSGIAIALVRCWVRDRGHCGHMSARDVFGVPEIGNVRVGIMTSERSVREIDSPRRHEAALPPSAPLAASIFQLSFHQKARTGRSMSEMLVPASLDTLRLRRGAKKRRIHAPWPSVRRGPASEMSGQKDRVHPGPPARGHDCDYWRMEVEYKSL